LLDQQRPGLGAISVSDHQAAARPGDLGHLSGRDIHVAVLLVGGSLLLCLLDGVAAQCDDQ
jgi:hypothetical protein